MSKIIEALEAGGESKKSGYQVTQEQLADIYFSGAQTPRRPDQPLLVQVVQKPGLASLVPWVITSFAFLITAFSLFSTKRVFVDIHVIDEKNPYLAELQAGARPLSVGQAGADVFGAGREKVSGGKVSLQNAVFEGAAKLNSSSDKTSLTLVNSSVASFARSTVYLDPPSNLSASKILFYAKGARGGENLAFALKDRNNILAFPKGKTYPFPNALSTEWQRVEVSLADTAREFDKKNVVSMRFDFGSKDTDNRPGDTVFVRDIHVVPLG